MLANQQVVPHLEDFRRELKHYQHLSQLMKLPKQRVTCCWHFSDRLHRRVVRFSRICSKRYSVPCRASIHWRRKLCSNVRWNDPIRLSHTRTVSALERMRRDRLCSLFLEPNLDTVAALLLFCHFLPSTIFRYRDLLQRAVTIPSTTKKNHDLHRLQQQCLTLIRQPYLTLWVGFFLVQRIAKHSLFHCTIDHRFVSSEKLTLVCTCICLCLLWQENKSKNFTRPIFLGQTTISIRIHPCRACSGALSDVRIDRSLAIVSRKQTLLSLYDIHLSSISVAMHLNHRGKFPWRGWIGPSRRRLVCFQSIRWTWTSDKRWRRHVHSNSHLFRLVTGLRGLWWARELASRDDRWARYCYQRENKLHINLLPNDICISLSSVCHALQIDYNRWYIFHRS